LLKVSRTLITARMTAFITALMTALIGL